MYLSPAIWEGILKSDKAKIDSEQRVLEAVLQYAEQFKDNPQKRDEVLTMLLPHIRWTFIPSKFLIKDIEQCDSLKNLPITHDILHEVYKFSALNSTSVLKLLNVRPRIGFQKIDKEGSSTQLNISTDLLEAGLTTSPGIWAGIKTIAPYSSSYRYCEWKVIGGGTSAAIGVNYGKIMDNQGSLTNVNNTILFYNGQVWYQGTARGNTARVWAVGDMVGVYVDVEKDKAICYINKSKVLESNLPTNSNVDKQFYPVIFTCSAGDKFQLQPNVAVPDDAGK